MSNYSQASAGAGLSAMCARLNGGSLAFYSGATPAAPTASLSANTSLASGTFSGAAFPAPTYDGSAYMETQAVFENSSFTPAASGAASFAVGATSGSVGESIYTVGSDFLAGQPVYAGQYCLSNGNTYSAATSGTAGSTAPSGTAAVSDGSITWNYVGAGQLFDILMGNLNVQPGVNITVTLTEKMPAK